MRVGSGKKVSGTEKLPEAQEKYFDLIEDVLNEFQKTNPFKHNHNLFLELCQEVGFESFKEEEIASKRQQRCVANLKHKEVKPLPVWTGRRTTILKPESQAIKDAILEFGGGVERFTRFEVRQVIRKILPNIEELDMTLHSQLVVMQRHKLIEVVGRGLRDTPSNGKKKINYYALVKK